MATDTKNQDNTEQSGNTGNEENSAQNQEEKIFSQAEVNQIISTRLAKEKEKYADYDTLKTKASETDQLKTEKTALEQKVQVSDTTLQEILDGMISSVDEDKKSLIPEQLSVVEKIKYINKNQNIFSVKVKAATPPAEDKNKGNSGLYGGKYQTLMEFATKDPKKYLEYRNSQ